MTDPIKFDKPKNQFKIATTYMRFEQPYDGPNIKIKADTAADAIKIATEQGHLVNPDIKPQKVEVAKPGGTK